MERGRVVRRILAEYAPHPSRVHFLGGTRLTPELERPESGEVGCGQPTPTLRPPLSSLLLFGSHRIGESPDEVDVPVT